MIEPKAMHSGINPNYSASKVLIVGDSCTGSEYTLNTIYLKINKNKNKNK